MKKSDDKPNRRTMISAAVAAGATVPLLSVSAQAVERVPGEGKGAKFMVRFDGFELSPHVQRKLADEIHGAAARVLEDSGVRVAEREFRLPAGWAGGWWGILRRREQL